MKKLLAILLLLASCAPQITETTPEVVTDLSSKVFINTYASQLNTMNIQLGDSVVYKYLGSDQHYFEQAIDRFYQSSPGFCPIEHGFLFIPGGSLFITLAGKKLAGKTDIRAFAYDLSSKPKITFSYLQGSSKTILKLKPCKTVSGS